MRTLFDDPESPVEFVPRRQDKAEEARLQTLWIRYIIEQNDGILKAHAVIKDGLVRAQGAFKWWWEDAEKRVVQMDAIALEQVMQLEADPDVEVTSIKPHFKRRRLTTKIKQLAGVMPPDVPLFDLEVTYYDSEGTAHFEEVPPEELVYSRQSRGVKRSLCVAHRTEKTKSDLLDMGYSEEDIEEAGGSNLWMNEEEQARRDDNIGEDPEAGDANRKTLYCEAYIPCDVDGDGRAELRKFCTLGDHYKVVHQEPVDEIPLAIYVPFPEPHTMSGQGLADKTMDIQRIKSAVLRGILDSAASSIFPRPMVEEGMASMADVLNNEIGAPIRIRKQGAVAPFVTPWIGEGMVPLVHLMDDTAERRTGRYKGAGGLDADALQSTTKSAADAAVQGSTEQVEFMIRMFCEQAWKPLFRGLRRLYVKHKPRKKVARLSGTWVDVDPATWDTDCDVIVRTLNSSMTEKRIMALTSIMAQQKEILASLGIDQPVVTPQRFANTLRRWALALGEREVDAYFGEVPEGWAPKPQEPQQDPATVLAMAQLEVEKMKTDRELKIAEAELVLKQSQHKDEQALEIAKLAVEQTLERMKINAQFQADYTNQQLQASAQAVEGYIAAEKLDLEEQQVAVDAALAADKQEKDHEVAQQKASQPKPKGE